MEIADTGSVATRPTTVRVDDDVTSRFATCCRALGLTIYDRRRPADLAAAQSGFTASFNISPSVGGPVSALATEIASLEAAMADPEQADRMDALVGSSETLIRKPATPTTVPIRKTGRMRKARRTA